MLTYSLKEAGNTAKYEFLYRSIKDDILKGKLTEGMRLPSKRSFSKHLNVSVVTVENAYAQLLAEGYIYAKPRSGFFVSGGIPGPVGPVPRMEETAAQPEERALLADLTSNRIDPRRFPFATWARLMREVISEESEALMTPAEGQGVKVLREAIAGHLLAFRGLSVRPEQIIVGAGTEYLYGLLIQLFGHDTVYAVEDPGYPTIRMIYQAHGVQCLPVPVDEKGLEPRALEAGGAEIVHLSPSHHFPTGVVMPVGRRYELFAWAQREPGRYIIEDDYDSEFRLSGNPIPPMAALDAHDKVVYMNTFTKSLAPAFRISYMVLPPALLREFTRRLGFYACTVSNFEQYTLARFIQKGYFEKHINRMRNRYRVLRDQLLRRIREGPLAGWGTVQEEAGLHFLLQVPTERSDTELMQSALRQGVRISCLSRYYARPETGLPHMLLVNYSGLDENRIEAAVSALERCL